MVKFYSLSKESNVDAPLVLAAATCARTINDDLAVTHR